MLTKKLTNLCRNNTIVRRRSSLLKGRRSPRKKFSVSSEERFLELMNSSMQSILIHSYDFVPLYVNQSYADDLDYGIDEIMQLDCIDRLYAVNEARRLKAFLRERLVKFSRNVPPSIYEVEAKQKSGDSVILQHSVSLIDWHGEPAVLISSTDITEKYLAQQALKLSEERFRDFADSASDWCWEMNENLQFSYMSSSFERIAGIPRSDILGLTRKEFMAKNMSGERLSQEDIQLWDEHYALLARREPFNDFEYNWHKDDGSIEVVSASGKPVFDVAGKFRGYRGTGRNVTAEKRLSEQLNYQATHDELTGLINRRHFDNEIHKAIDDAHVNNVSHVLVFMDLDRFKIVNDTCGHVAGDELLQQIASMFQNIFSKRDILGRMGGDEFAAIMSHCTVEQSLRVTQRIHEEFEAFRFVWDGKTFSVGVSAGIASIDNHSESVSGLLQNVDGACYIAKQTGRNKTHIFSEKDEDFSQRQGEMRWIGRITEAFENDDFVLYAQSILPLQSDQGAFYELLLRMEDGADVIAPGLFLPAAERYDLSIKIDRWVLRQALEWIASCPPVLEKTKHVFINLSGKTIGNKSFQRYTMTLLKEYDVQPEKICFEITETTAIANLAEAIDFIKDLKELGCFFALDDFGSGVSSFGYLKNLPVDYLKIDGMFIRDMYVNEVNLAMVKSINDISHVMGKKTIAEFVEDDRTFGMLRNIGIDYAQGYGIDYPMPLGSIGEHELLKKPK
ncbi:MAG: putative bifunctional diguanylate cyclase/phosphodiesterase [Cellvibrionaceae bacterium]